MADAVTARWHGDNYQARVFWENALNLLDDQSCVVEVTFEANGPKSFDDVVVHYEPPVARSGPDRVSAEYHQIKWHVETGGRFGYEDLVRPDFIGAKSVSLLQRLKDAHGKVPARESANFLQLTESRTAIRSPVSFPAMTGRFCSKSSSTVPGIAAAWARSAGFGAIISAWKIMTN